MAKPTFNLQNTVLFLLLFVQHVFGVDYFARLGAQSVFLQRAKRQSTPVKPALKITDYRVQCSVVSRYALTTVHSTVWNQLPLTKEAAFQVDLPPSAFISNFTITSNGKVYVAQVKERSAARKIYDAAKKQGKTAGLVATKEREIEKFRVAVSVPSGASMSFSLTYEELLSRRLGHYELVLGLRPGQPVQNLSLDVSIGERTGISFMKVLPLRTTRLLSSTVQGEVKPPPSTQIQQGPGCAQIHYSPTPQQQRAISPKGLNADFIIQYDVELKDLMGDIQVYDGYFVHYFAPRGLPVVPKDVIFVIDISGSMTGTKIKQTKQAMSTILGDLREGDYFNLITFSDKVHIWKKGRTVQATRQNVREAKEFVKKIVAEGWTNINAALLSAAQLVNPSSSSSTKRNTATRRVPMIIFLTDGEATIGVTTGDIILRNAKNALGSASLFGLAFGDDADFPLLRRLALENRGVARMVYEDADATLQLKGFYDEVASPLLSDIQLSYLDNQAYDITRALFPNYFQGSELVVTGRVKPGVRDLKVSLMANDSKQKFRIETDLAVPKAEGNGTAQWPVCPGGLEGIPSFVRRLWAYLTIKELLLAKLNSTDTVTQRLLSEKATNLSLKYNFVTPVTSLVVVKPDVKESPKPTIGSSTSATTKAPATSSATTTTANMTSQNSSKKPRTSKPPPTRPPRPQPPPGLHTTGRPSPGKTVPPPSAKKTSTPPSLSKTSPVAVSGKLPTTPLSATKTVPAPGPERSTDYPTSAKISPTTKTSTAPPSAVKTIPVTQAAKTTPLLNPVKTALPAEPDLENSSVADLHQSQVTTLHSGLRDESSSTPSPVDTDSDSNLNIATLVAGTFAPMPGVTDVPKPWEAAGILDVSTSIQFQRKDIDLVKDYDATYDYDYDYSVHYDTYSDAEEDASPDSITTLSSVRVFSSSVDGDPHFVVQIPKLHENLCFTIDGNANDVLRLVEDPEQGITVNGHLMLAPSKLGLEDRTRTYFDRITIISSVSNFMITLTVDAVVVEGEELEMLPTNQQGSVTQTGLRVVVDSQGCWIELERNVRFLILFHHYKHPSYFQKEHLGFYIADGKGLSPLTKGLLGQFQHANMEVLRMNNTAVAGFHHAQISKESSLALGMLMTGDIQIPVSLQNKNLKDTFRKRHPARCWVVPKVEVEKLLGHPYQSYVVDHL
ncbi:inter-alpha-trypsin inhibitor heavy chain H6 [Chanos chanos]|uniref:Inter-alpha-trypsin inhibitor heavy chain H6 n=1 Tax=Chanos chanos TaxID=29144 RepID=A0A6J2UUY9_CHACN|nr:inter-alpha-trypsin inhibitor heavy chain H6-like [Chanos chanos]